LEIYLKVWFLGFLSIINSLGPGRRKAHSINWFGNFGVPIINPILFPIIPNFFGKFQKVPFWEIKKVKKVSLKN